MKKIALAFLIVLPHPAYSSFKAVGAIGIGTVGVYALFNWLSKPDTRKPTIAN